MGSVHFLVLLQGWLVDSVSRWTRATQCSITCYITYDLEFVPQDDPDTRHYSFNPSRRAWIRRFGTPRGIESAEKLFEHLK